ncbi:hypothetical protein B0H14DRAFT_2416740, partial [Mycena olivaceomarginata]
WLTRISRQLSGDFDNKFYRKKIAPNMLHFLQIKEDLKSVFEFKCWSKSYTSNPVFMTRRRSYCNCIEKNSIPSARGAAWGTLQ